MPNMKNFLIIFTLFVLSACSFKSLVIPNLHFLIVSRIDKNLGLYGEQEIVVRKEIISLLKSNTDLARQIISDLENIKLNEFDSHKGYKLLRERYLVIANRVSAIMAKQIALFDDKQIKRFYEINEEKNEDIQESIDEREVKDFYKRYEFFLGDLNQKQKELVKENFEVFKVLSKQRLKNRINTQNELKEAFKIKDINEKEKAIFNIFERSSSLPMSKERSQVISLFGEIVKAMDKEQINHFNEKRVEWIGWLNYFIDYFSKTDLN